MADRCYKPERDIYTCTLNIWVFNILKKLSGTQYAGQGECHQEV